MLRRRSEHAQLPVVEIGRLLASDPLPPPGGPMRLHLTGCADAEAPAVLRHCFGRLGYQYELSRLPDTSLAVDLALNILPGIVVADGTLLGLQTSRRSVHVQDDTDILMFINRSGPHLIEQFGREEVLGEGDAILVSGADPSVFTHRPPGGLLALRVGRDSLLPLLRGGAAALMRRIPAGTPALDLLGRYLDLTWIADDGAPKGLMASHIRDLVAAAAGSAAEGGCNGGLRAARLEAVKQDLANRIQDPELSLADVAARHHMTPRTLQRLFEAEGTTFSRHLLETRLAAAHLLLSLPRARAEKISAIAYECGFGDLSYFNRAFRRHFGLSPSDLRGMVSAGA